MSTRPSKPERDELRRAEIVLAARRCVVQKGFHAAGMAQIAAEAGMSVGQVYRYFDNKEAIVHAIVEGIVTERLAWIGSTGGKRNLAKLLASRMLAESAEDADDRALQLEVAAEATRNPKVAEIARKADAQLHAQAVKTVLADHPQLTAKQAAARVEFVAVLTEGTAFRKLTHQAADLRELTSVYQRVLDELLPGVKG